MARILLREDDRAPLRKLAALLHFAGYAADGDFVMQHLEVTGGIMTLASATPPFVSAQPLTTGTATSDSIGRGYYTGFNASF